MAKGNQDSAWRRARRRVSWQLGLLLASVAMVLALLALLGLVVVMEFKFRLTQDEMVPPKAISQKSLSFTMRVNTFRRNDLLRQSLEHYSRCPNVREITVVWSDQKLAPPATKKWDISPVGPAMEFERHASDRLSNRFKPLGMPPTEAILSIDDDILIPCDSLDRARRVWESAKDSLVGFSPRLHTWDAAAKRYVYRSWWYTYWNGLYSIMLTKSAFLHRDFLQHFQELPGELVQFVDSNRNCEDILMAFVVAKESRGKPAIWVGAPAIDKGDGGISSGNTHFDHRSACINRFAAHAHFAGMPLAVTNVKVVDARREWTWAA